MGRRFDDDKILHEAIEQYRFLRREYPGSKFRFEALFTIGEIYQDDLDDPQAARAAFQEFLRHYPRNHLAEDARQAIAALAQPAVNAAASERAADQKSADKKRENKVVAENHDTSGESPKDANSQKVDHSPDDVGSANVEEPGRSESAQIRPGRLPRVTGIRHWSTPDYTRVAIDLETDVKFSSERIGRPARIYFDLADTRLASTLVGKSFDVDDGFLKKVRVAQFTPRRTRIVLEVDNLSDYDAFLLPNPSRLIIDIHGKDVHGKNAQANARRRPADTEAESIVPAKNNENNSEDVASNSNPVFPSEPVTAENVESRNEEISGRAESVATGPTLSKPPQNGIVKRIVEADDDDSESTPV
ncbi:MAG: AMIN domain-containing protein, partial [Candidatus Sulfotelmatobacter sp.]